MSRGGRLGARWALVSLVAPGLALAAPCFAPADIDGFASFEVVATSAHFAAAQRSGGAPFDAAGLLDLLEEARSDYLDRGWIEPAGMDQHEQLVFVDEAAGGVLARSDAAPCAGSPTGFQDWMTLNQEVVDDEAVAGPVVAHELFHAIQRTYDVGLVDDPGENLWFLEASASYEEALVFPAWTQAVTDRSRAWSANPQVGLRMVDGSHEYASFVFLRAVEAVQGTPGWHRELWEGLGAGWEAVDEVLAVVGVDEDALMGEYLVRAAEMDLPGPGTLVNARTVEPSGLLGRMEPGDGGDTFGTCPADGIGGACLLWLDGALASDGQEAAFVRVSYEGFPEDTGGLAPWRVAVAAVRDGVVVDQLTAGRSDWSSDDVVTLVRFTVDGLASLDGVWVATSPAASGPEAWVSPSLIEGGDEVAITLEPFDLGPCGCSTSGPGPSSVAFLPLFILLRRRR